LRPDAADSFDLICADVFLLARPSEGLMQERKIDTHKSLADSIWTMWTMRHWAAQTAANIRTCELVYAQASRRVKFAKLLHPNAAIDKSLCGAASLSSDKIHELLPREISAAISHEFQEIYGTQGESQLLHPFYIYRHNSSNR
jgi:hypothetical protein